MNLSQNNFSGVNTITTAIFIAGYEPIPFQPFDDSVVKEYKEYKSATYETKNKLYEIRVSCGFFTYYINCKEIKIQHTTKTDKYIFDVIINKYFN